jgi:hypothetical protein
MARTVREVTLSNRSARLRLPVGAKPNWRALEQGLHLGYRRRATGGCWIARRRIDGGPYREGGLGLADDLQDADGTTVLDFSQAQVAARQWWLNEQNLDHGLAVPVRGPYTVKRACADYLEDYRRRGGNAIDVVGDIPVTKLTAPQLQDWHRSIAERPRRLRTRAMTTQKYATLEADDPNVVRQRRASANRVLTFLKAALNHAWRSGAVPSDGAWRRVKPFRAVDAPSSGI